MRYNFQKLNESQVDDYGVEYDYSSIMHYGRTFFSTDGKSTTLRPLDDTAEIGQRLQLSPLDILQANKLYMCREFPNVVVAVVLDIMISTLFDL